MKDGAIAFLQKIIKLMENWFKKSLKVSKKNYLLSINKSNKFLFFCSKWNWSHKRNKKSVSRIHNRIIIKSLLFHGLFKSLKLMMFLFDLHDRFVIKKWFVTDIQANKETWKFSKCPFFLLLNESFFFLLQVHLLFRRITKIGSGFQWRQKEDFYWTDLDFLQIDDISKNTCSVMVGTI